MLRARVIPCLLLKGAGLVKTVKFSDPKYVGDPINAVRIFNEKEVDELVLLDIEASKKGEEPNYDLIEQIASEAFMPVCYGGGISTLQQAKQIVALGIEKISINASALQNPQLVSELAQAMGSQSVVASIDVKKDWLGHYGVWDAKKGKTTGASVEAQVLKMEQLGAGEIFLNSVDRDGTQQGYDLKCIQQATHMATIPLIACGGAGNLTHFREAVSAGASAVAAGSMFVYMGKHRAVMINYPHYKDLQEVLPHG